jgi:hypothetical protein
MSDLHLQTHIEMQENCDIILCPMCRENFYTPYGVKWEKGMPSKPALSRRDNKTYICSPCGNSEAFEDFERVYGIKIEEV